MDFKIISIVLMVLALFSLLNALDYHQEYERSRTWFTNKAALRYCRAVKIHRNQCFIWGICWVLGAGFFWILECLWPL